MCIEFKEGAPSVINCKVYLLTCKETDILQEFLNEEERKGYIKAGSSQYTSPVFFVGKKDSKELQPVMDYRKINEWTIHDKIGSFKVAIIDPIIGPIIFTIMSFLGPIFD